MRSSPLNKAAGPGGRSAGFDVWVLRDAARARDEAAEAFERFGARSPETSDWYVEQAVSLRRQARRARECAAELDAADESGGSSATFAEDRTDGSPG